MLLASTAAFYEFLPQIIRYHVSLVALCVGALATWRVYRFRIIPALYPDDPKELPYWIPAKPDVGRQLTRDSGHLIAFFGNSNALLTRATRYFGYSMEPYALSVAGLKTYVLTNADHVGEAYRNTETLSYEEFVRGLMRILGNSQAGVKAMFTPLAKDKEGFPNPHEKPLGLLFRQMHIHQLFPGENLDFLETRFYKFFKNHLELARISDTCPYAVSKSSEDVVLPLTQWCSDFFVRGGQGAYFGPKLAYQVIYQYPRFLAKAMLTARDGVLNSLRDYLQLPHNQRREDAWFVKAMEEGMRAVGLSDEDMAIATMTIYWAYVLSCSPSGTPSLVDTVWQETLPAFRDDGTVDFEYLHTSVPNLDGVWNEMLRLSTFAASVRFITADTIIGTKVLRKGNRLIIPYRQLHMDKSVYGADVDQFRHSRFLENPRLTQTNRFRPFGGGATMCPGRHIAKRAVYLFTAMVLHEFDIEIVGQRRALEPDLTKPVPGLMSPQVGQELHVKLSPRKRSMYDVELASSSVRSNWLFVA
ncbi:hypothetical protein HIM_11060 [Hirsutella minnesotensis 3608]|uniref:Cytochrome P450 n=1 Tax=Hirsutella minnesotensis 3608 TaxID=1043627 RepID=A0A0F7ZWT8_9HYPO|nr:hypothetical protein HIM_11060 [Hirsutella minnesotensis 3608]